MKSRREQGLLSPGAWAVLGKEWCKDLGQLSEKLRIGKCQQGRLQVQEEARVRGLMSHAGGLVLEAEGSSRKSIDMGLGCVDFRTVILEVKGRGVEWIETR